MDSNPELQVPEIVTEENLRKIVAREERKKLRYERLKASDRRKNFESGETAGALFVAGLSLIASGAHGNVIRELPDWERIFLVASGLICLGVKTYMKRRFWRNTEEAEQDEIDAY